MMGQAPLACCARVRAQAVLQVLMVARGQHLVQ